MLYYISFCFTSVLFQNVLKVKKTKQKWSIFILVFILSIFMTTIYATLALLLLFWTYRSVVLIMAKLKFGPNFLGFVEGMYTSSSNNATTALLILEDKCNSKNVFEIVSKIINEKIVQNASLPKFQSHFKTFLGYECLIKKEVSLQCHVKKLPTIDHNDFISETELMSLLSECWSLPLPSVEGTLWDAFVGVQRLQWGSKDRRYYPVFVRIHNGISDGQSLLNVFSEVLADNNTSPQSTIFENITYYCLDFINGIYTLLLTPACLLNGFHYKGEERNFIHRPDSSGIEVLSFKVEESENYIDKIKRIRNRIPGATFSDVVITAFSGSLKDYFQKICIKCPETITKTQNKNKKGRQRTTMDYACQLLSIPVITGDNAAAEIVEIHSPLYPEYLTSAIHVRPSNSKKLKPSIIFINLPLFFDSNDQPLLNRLDLVKTQTNFRNRSMELKINDFLRGIACSVTPYSMLYKVFGDLPRSSNLCFVSGPKQLALEQGKWIVANCVFWLPQQNNCGLNLSLMSYGNYLHVGLNSDQSYIRSPKCAEEILNGVFKNLDKLEEELCICQNK